MWRREVIRLVLACNWTVAGLSLGMGLYPHFCEWWTTADDLVRVERGAPPWNAGEIEPRTPEQKEADSARGEQYRAQIYPLYRSGRNGWLWASGTCTTTAALLMLAFPKKPEALGVAPPVDPAREERGESS